MKTTPTDSKLLRDTLQLTEAGELSPQSKFPFLRFTTFALRHYVPTPPDFVSETSVADVVSSYRGWASRNPYRGESYMTDGKLSEYLRRHLLCLGLPNATDNQTNGTMLIRANRTLSATGLAQSSLPAATAAFIATLREQLQGQPGYGLGHTGIAGVLEDIVSTRPIRMPAHALGRSHDRSQ